MIANSTSDKVVRVIHVDDDAFFLRSAKQHLEKIAALQVDSVRSADEALKKLEQEKYDVVISDFNMQEKNGLEFLIALRANGATIPFILFASKERPEVAVKALNLGVFRYVEKPGDPKRAYDELLAGIQQAHKHQQSQEWLRSIYDNQQSGILIIDAATQKIVDANPAALELTGSSKEQLVGRLRHAVIYSVEKNNCPTTGQSQTIPKTEKVLIKRNLKKLPVLAAVNRATIAGKEYLIESFLDITERKLREKSLRESHQKFMALFSENPEAVAFCDDKFGVIDVNPRFASLFDCAPECMKGRNAIEMFTPEKLKHQTNWIKQKLREGNTECRTIRERADGTVIHVSLSGAPVIYNNNVIGYVLVYRDINDIVLANEELSRLVDEQNVTLRKTSLLNEKLIVTGGLTRHDVRNKLTGLTGNAYIAKKRSEGNTVVVNCLVQIEEISRNIVRILDFAKTYELLGTQEQTRINVGKVVEEAASLFEDLKGVCVVHECGDFEVLADSLLMELFHNLIDNSLKYGKKITQIKVQRRFCQDGSTELIYEDNGVGIVPEMKANLFQKGFGKGTGYGLYLIKRICANL
jgi:PAS domain S-box-containing protein